MRSGHSFYRTTKLLDRQRETHLSKCKWPPFIYSLFNMGHKTGQDYRVPPLNFFRHCDFFEIFLSPKGPPSSFLIFYSKLKFQKSQRVPLSIFWHCETFPKIEISPFNFLMICDRMDVEKPQRVPLSLFRHCETFFLSPKGPPFNFFDNLQQIGCLKIPKGPPFSFSALRLFFEILFFSPKGPRFNCD